MTLPSKFVMVHLGLLTKQKKLPLVAPFDGFWTIGWNVSFARARVLSVWAAALCSPGISPVSLFALGPFSAWLCRREGRLEGLQGKEGQIVNPS